MKMTKIPEDFLKTSELGRAVQLIMDKLKALSDLKASLAKSATLSLDTGKPAIDPFQLAAILKATKPEAVALIKDGEAIYDSLRQWALAESNRLIASFDPKLRAFCEKQGYKLEGRYPQYTIEGFLPLRARENDRETELGIRTIPSLLVDTLAPNIRDLVLEERARKYNRDQFLDLLWQAYERSLLLQKASVGDPIPVRKIYQELVLLRQPDAFLKSAKKALFSEYTIDFFARDLGRLLDSAPCQTKNGKWLSDRPTSFAPEGIPVLQGGQTRIVGRLVFSTEQP